MMAKVEIIRAKKPLQKQENQQKCRVGAYCRVSTDSEEQEGSYEAQVSHYTAVIRANPDWELAGIYADEGISGTQVKRRKEFGRMIDDCNTGKIDLVITKSISRFARNTLDCIRYIRELKSLGIPIIFEKEHINTMDAKGELFITIMASIAQEESQSISQNVRMGIQYRMQQGKGRVNTSVLLGLNRGADGRLCPVAGEADTVRAIYRAFVNGEGANAIARRLEREGVPTPTKKSHWFPSSVVRILTNEKYCGDLLLQKYFVKDFLTHRTIPNKGNLPMYFVANAHDPVVPKAVFEEVQGEMLRRSSHRHEVGILREGSLETLNRRLVCAKCGRILRKCILPGGEVQWQCRLRPHTKKRQDFEGERKCWLRHVPEERAKEGILNAFSKLPDFLDVWIRPNRKAAEETRQIFDEETKQMLEGSESGESVTATVRRWMEDAKTTDKTKTLQRAELTRKYLDLRALEELAEEIENHRHPPAAANQPALPDHSEPVILSEAQDPTPASATLPAPVILSEAKDLINRDATENTHKTRIPQNENRTAPAACHDYEDFYERTKLHFSDEIFEENGKFRQFDDALIIRYLDKVIVSDEALAVQFKAGLIIKVKRPDV